LKNKIRREKKMKKKILSGIMLVGILSGCTNMPNGMNNKAVGTAGGAAAGALVGQLIGQNTKGTLIGAGIGALAGLGWGAYKDEQAKALKQQLAGTEVGISTEGEAINLNLPGGVTFATNSATINPSFYTALDSICNVLVQYPETRIQVSGFTDNTGALAYNRTLSQERAQSVANYIVRRGVNPSRITAIGFGPDMPIASNATAAGRAQNRRVELQILPLNQ
jgi:chemotaxis protein MotB